jgi:hypothetical protein
MNTAVEWIEETIGKDNMGNFLKDVLQKAKEMEKEQIKDAWLNAWKDSMINPLEDKYYEPEAEQYYNETYGKQ